MELYKVEFLPSVIKKDFKKINKSDALKIMLKIKLLEENPRPVWSKKLSARVEYRNREGNYRISYVNEDTVKVLKIVKIGNRRDVYLLK